MIVAGFQGVNPETREITTLGRGGSDTTAVALAAALGHSLCEIYTDVSGVYTADPRTVPAARVIPRLSYRVCSTLAHLGGRVLHARCVDLAAAPRTARGALLVRRSTRNRNHGADMEGPRVDAVTHRADQTLAIAEGNAGARGEARSIIEAVAEARPELELIAHEQVDATHGVIVWSGNRPDAEALARDFKALRGPGGEWRLDLQHGAAFVAVVGLGLGAHEAARAEAALERASVAFAALRTSPTALVFRLASDRAEAAVRALHAEFLEASAIARG